MSRAKKYDAELENIELQLLVEGVRRYFGINLEEYAGSALRRQVWLALRAEKMRTVSGLLEKLLHEPDALDRFMDGFNRAEPSGPGFFKYFRNEIVPVLRTYPFVKIWQAGAESLRDFYFMAIILHEEGFYEKSTIYVTDSNKSNLDRAQDGMFPLGGARELEKTYNASGGRGRLGEYFSGGRLNGVFKPQLRRNMVFAQHNLATDGSFNEFNMIACRQGLEPLSDAARAHAHEILFQSLGMFGVLALGPQDSVRNTPFENAFKELDAEQRIYRKIATLWP
jgi:chemotaxis protein methyltransferase CheR